MLQQLVSSDHHETSTPFSLNSCRQVWFFFQAFVFDTQIVDWVSAILEIEYLFAVSLDPGHATLSLPGSMFCCNMYMYMGLVLLPKCQTACRFCAARLSSQQLLCCECFNERWVNATVCCQTRESAEQNEYNPVPITAPGPAESHTLQNVTHVATQRQTYSRFYHMRASGIALSLWNNVSYSTSARPVSYRGFYCILFYFTVLPLHQLTGFRFSAAFVFALSAVASAFFFASGYKSTTVLPCHCSFALSAMAL